MTLFLNWNSKKSSSSVSFSDHFYHPVGSLFVCIQHRETLLGEIQRNLCRSSLQSTSADVDWLPRRWVRSPLSFHPNQSFSVRARMIILSSQYFSFDPLYSSFTKTIYTTVSFLYRRVVFDTVADESDLMVMNIVLYPPHVHKRNVLSSSCPSSRTTNPY